MGSKRNPLELDEHMMDFIESNAENKTLPEMLEAVKCIYPAISYNMLYSLASKHNIHFKPGKPGAKKRAADPANTRRLPPGKRSDNPPEVVLKHAPKDPPPPPPKMTRPAAVYNQTSSPYGIASSERHL